MLNRFINRISHNLHFSLKTSSLPKVENTSIRHISNNSKKYIQSINNNNTTSSLSSTRLFKTRVSLKKRCPDCYFVTRKGKLKVLCKSSPRHKQTQ